MPMESVSGRPRQVEVWLGGGVCGSVSERPLWPSQAACPAVNLKPPSVSHTFTFTSPSPYLHLSHTGSLTTRGVKTEKCRQIWTCEHTPFSSTRRPRNRRCFTLAWSVTRTALSVRTPAKLFLAPRLFQWSVLQPAKSWDIMFPFSDLSSFQVKVKRFTKMNISTTLDSVEKSSLCSLLNLTLWCVPHTKKAWGKKRDCAKWYHEW